MVSKYDSKVSVFSVDDSGASLRAISPYVTGVDGLPGASALNDVTAFGDSGHKFIRGLENITFTIEGPYDDTATVGSKTVLSGIRNNAVTVSFEYGPQGGSNPDVKYSGEAWMTELVFPSRVGSHVTFRATFQVDGVITVGTY